MSLSSPPLSLILCLPRTSLQLAHRAETTAGNRLEEEEEEEVGSRESSCPRRHSTPPALLSPTRPSDTPAHHTSTSTALSATPLSLWPHSLTT